MKAVLFPPTDLLPCSYPFADCANGNCYCLRHVMKQMFPVLSAGNFFLLMYISYLYSRMLLYLLRLVVMLSNWLDVSFVLL